MALPPYGLKNEWLLGLDLFLDHHHPLSRHPTGDHHLVSLPIRPALPRIMLKARHVWRAVGAYVFDSRNTFGRIWRRRCFQVRLHRDTTWSHLSLSGVYLKVKSFYT
jgi:hypothetical protein